MKTTLKLLFLVLLLTAFSCSVPHDKYRIVGYIAGSNGYDFSKVDAKKLTHINYAFANIINGEVMFDTSKFNNIEQNKNDLKALRHLRKINPDLRVLISVGGWGWSGNFSDAALNDSTRERFAGSAVRFISENDLDGIDLDWEYPNQIGAGNKFRKEDVDNFTLMIKAIREKLDSLTTESSAGREYLISVATGGDSAYIANTKLGEVAEYVDFINIMSYDLHNGNTPQSGHHTNLYMSRFDSPYGNATDRSVKMHLQAGVPAEKLNIGIPFYGRRWKHVKPVNYGLYQDSPAGGQGISYEAVKKALSDPLFEKHWDSTASAPWLWNSRDSVFISYDDTTSIRIKMEYIRKNRLGGVMFWEYTEDTDGKLLDAVYKDLN